MVAATRALKSTFHSKKGCLRMLHVRKQLLF